MSSVGVLYKYNLRMPKPRRKNDIEPEVIRFEPADLAKLSQGVVLRNASGGFLRDYIKFAFYCMLLAVPLYAITISILNHDWVMVIIDALIVPVGFVHGLLLFFGYVT